MQTRIGINKNVNFSEYQSWMVILWEITRTLLLLLFPGPRHKEPIFVYFRPFAHALLGLQLLLVFLHQK